MKGQRNRWLARGKFLEFDELENIRCPAGTVGDVVTVRLHPRDERVPQPDCRIAAVTVRYRCTAPSRTLDVDRWVKAGGTYALVQRAVGDVRLARADILWADHGPAMGALSVGGAKTRYANVCSGERYAFCFGWAARRGQVKVHADTADVHIQEISLYGDAL